MVLTSVGYAGGTRTSPTYRDLGDHTESFQLYFDPKAISFDELVDLFFGEHDPYAGSWSTQYMNIAFYENAAQRAAIERKVAALENSGRQVRTRVAGLGTYTVAEDYHQKHTLRQYGEYLRPALEAEGGLFGYAATRLNGYLGGYGKCETLAKEAGSFGLGPELEEGLIKKVCGSAGIRGVTCPVPGRL